MNTLSNMSRRSPSELGIDQLALIERLYPICRSITGDGLRETLSIISEHLPLETREIPSGTEVFDWVVPREWNIRDAYVKNSRGERIVDFAESNLMVVNYSSPIRQTMSLAELKPHLHTLPDHPDWIPYRTTYYREDWGFCLRHRDLERLEEDDYEVVIDATLADGSLTYGELYLPGRRQDEVLLTTHVCHPSMCNDNLSGIAVLTAVGLALSQVPREYSYRLLFIPGTIGAIAWLAGNHAQTKRIKHGLVLAGLGDAQPFTYKRSRQGDAEIDRGVAHVLAHQNPAGRLQDFSPYGYDERQFCSPGFDLPVGRLSRAEYNTYPEYHTSADNLDFVSEASLSGASSTILQILSLLETNRRYRNTIAHCEPQLGKRGLYDDSEGRPLGHAERLALLWVLNLSDRQNSLLDIAERANVPFDTILSVAKQLEAAGIIEELGDN
jgi:aminopeptidase-like protein